MTGVHLAIIEDSEMVRRSLIECIQSDEIIQSIQEFNSIEEFLWERSINPIPNVLLLDINLPRISGSDAIEDILLKYPSLNIIIYTMYMDIDNIVKVISKGATGYLLKSKESTEEILEAIKIVHNGGSYLSPLIARKVIALFHPSSITKKNTHLTQREEQVLNRLTLGYTYQTIADELHISIDTVRTYIKNIYTKMKVKNKTQLVTKVQGLFH